mgnify:FL=1
MLIQDLVSQIDTKDTPIFFHNEPIAGSDYCYARTTTASELAELRGKKDANYREDELGVHLVNLELQDVYNNYLKKNPVAVSKLCALLTEQCAVPTDKIIPAYVLFTVLHEIGHWQHLVRSGLTRTEYWKEYEAQRDDLWMEFQFMYHFCRNKQEQQYILDLYDGMYRNLPSERFADDFAKNELPQYLDLMP